MRAVVLVLALFSGLAVAQHVVARSPDNTYQQNIVKERLVRARRSRLAARQAAPSNFVTVGIPVLNSNFNIVRASVRDAADEAQCPIINGLAGVLGLTGLTITPSSNPIPGVLYLSVRHVAALQC